MTRTHLSQRVRRLTPSATLAIEAKAKELQRKGLDIISFAAGEPDFDTPDPIKEAAIESLRKGFTKYTAAQGILELREAISSKFEKENNLRYPPDQIVVSCGAKHALYNVLQVLIDPGDTVLLPSPYWLSFPEMVRLAGGRIRFLRTSEKSGFKISASELQEAITPRTKCLILNSPCNPTGAVYERAELEAIAEVLMRRSLYVVTDEIYEKLVYDGRRHVSLASLDPEMAKKTVTVNGHSKTFAMTGWRIGYLGAPRDIAQAVANLQSHSTSNPTSFAQAGALAAFRTDSQEIERRRGILERRRDLIFRLASGIPGLLPFKPQGAFYLFCGIGSTRLGSLQFAGRLLEEKKISVVPGLSFGSDRHIRLSFATSEESIQKGLERIRDWMQKI